MSDKQAPKELLEMWTRMVNPMLTPMQTLLFPTVKPEELDRKLTELRAVETWLTANLGMLQLTIKTLEYQRAILTPRGEAPPATEEEKPSLTGSAMWPWNIMKPSPAPTDPEPPPPGSKAARKKAG